MVGFCHLGNLPESHDDDDNDDDDDDDSDDDESQPKAGTGSRPIASTRQSQVIFGLLHSKYTILSNAATAKIHITVHPKIHITIHVNLCYYTHQHTQHCVPVNTQYSSEYVYNKEQWIQYSSQDTNTIQYWALQAPLRQIYSKKECKIMQRDCWISIDRH